MAMNSMKMKRIHEDRIARPNLRTIFNQNKDVFQIKWKETKKGIKVKLPQIIAKYNERGQVAIDELVDHLEEALTIMDKEHELSGMEKNIYPVIRSTSFPTKTNSGKKLVTKEHTAETRIFFALDLGKSYRLLTEEIVESEDWSQEKLYEMALFNARSLPTDYKEDSVNENIFYFVSSQDGYDASRILNDAFLEEMASKNASFKILLASYPSWEETSRI